MPLFVTTYLRFFLEKISSLELYISFVVGTCCDFVISFVYLGECVGLMFNVLQESISFNISVLFVMFSLTGSW